MRVFDSYAHIAEVTRNGVVAIGNFDGVHVGHQALIAKARAITAPVAVLSFTPHPRTFFCPNVPHFYLCSDQQKLDSFDAQGVEVALLQRFDDKMISMTKEEFITKFLEKGMKVGHVVVGADFKFGAGANGTVADLQTSQKFVTHVVDDVMVSGQKVSSSAIRHYLHNGDIANASSMLGRPYSLRGRVVEGKKNGRILGFATANVVAGEGFGLKTGVYITTLRNLSGESKMAFLSVTNVGCRPTFDAGKAVVVETHVLDQNLDLYGHDIEISFLERLRDEQKFASLDELRAQIARDIAAARKLIWH